MTINSKIKGKVGELEFAEFARNHGFPAARRDGQQGNGGSVEAPDVSGIPGLHIEVKRRESGNLYDWMDQAIRDATGSYCTPAVSHRRNHKDWMIILRAKDFLEIYKRSLKHG